MKYSDSMGRASILAILTVACFCVPSVRAQVVTAPVDDSTLAARKSLRRGLDWLKEKQRQDGGWSNSSFPAMTGLALWAFARSDHRDRATVCSNAAAFIEKYVQPDGGIYRPAGLVSAGGLATYNTAVCMAALHTYDRSKYEPTLLAARKFIASSQLTGDSPGAGGFGYERPSDPSKPDSRARADLSNTAWSARAMRLTQDLEDKRPGGATVDVNWDSMLKYVEKLQNMDANDPENKGGFAYEQGGGRAGATTKKDGTVKLMGFGSMTYAGLESMIYAKVDRSDPRVQSALLWASKHWTLDENPGMGTKGLFYYYNTMAKALAAAGVKDLPSPSGAPVPWRNQMIARLTAIQQADGSWVNKDNSLWEGDPVLVTSYSSLAIESILGQ